MNQQDVFNAFDKVVKTREDCLNMASTMLGLSATQTEFLIKNCNPSEIPLEVHYAMILTAGNMMAVLSGSSYIAVEDLDLREISTKEKMINVLKHLIKVYKDDLC